VQHIGKSKVTKLNAKAGVVYPLIRLPKTYANEIGNVAEIFETQQDNRRALLVTFNDGAAPSEVIQPDSKVIQPEGLNSVDSRLLELESEISGLKSLLLEIKLQRVQKAKKERPSRDLKPESEPRQGTSQAKLAPARSARSL